MSVFVASVFENCTMSLHPFRGINIQLSAMIPRGTSSANRRSASIHCVIPEICVFEAPAVDTRVKARHPQFSSTVG